MNNNISTLGKIISRDIQDLWSLLKICTDGNWFFPHIDLGAGVEMDMDSYFKGIVHQKCNGDYSSHDPTWHHHPRSFVIDLIEKKTSGPKLHIVRLTGFVQSEIIASL